MKYKPGVNVKPIDGINNINHDANHQFKPNKKTLLMVNAARRNVITNLKLINQLSKDFNVIFVTFVNRNIVEKYVKKYLPSADNITIYYIQEMIDIKKIFPNEILRDIPVYKIYFADPFFYKFLLKKPTKMQKEFIKYFNAIYKILNEEKIDAFITFGEEGIYHLIPYYLCKMKNIKIIFFRPVPYHGFTVTEDFFGHFTLLKSNKKLFPVERKEIDNYFSLVKKEIYSGHIEKIDIEKIIEKIKKIGASIYYGIRDSRNLYKFYTIKKWLFPFVVRKVRYFVMRVLGRYEEIDQEEDFFFFPLHFTEDAQIRLRAPEFYNQFELIKAIALNIPPGTLLYVKEHPFYKGGYPVKSLLDMARVPNIKLIDPNISSKRILKHAKAVITINSTVGFEGLFFHKPCFCLSKAFYDEFEGVTRVRNVSDLSKYLTDKYIEKQIELIEKNLYKNVESLLSISCKGGKISGEGFLSKDNIKKIISIIKKMTDDD